MKSSCCHKFEQRGFAGHQGTYVTCAGCHKITNAPEYGICVKCGVLMCVGCIFLREESPQLDAFENAETSPDLLAPDLEGYLSED